MHADRGDAERTVGLTYWRRGGAQTSGDLRVRELVGRLLEERVSEGDRGVERDPSVLRDLLAPELGDLLAAELSADDAERP
ncbi:MAG: hypothetical protein ACRD03_12345 [Acidimicrobiales bacterium]